MRLLLIFTLLLGWSSEAGAVPTISKLDDVVKMSTDVVIASFVASPDPIKATNYDLVVERALRGAAVPKRTLRVKAAYGGHAFFPTGTRLVAFMDRTGTFHWAATLAAGTTLEDGVLRVVGFNDGNSHSVLPGILTLEQLEALIGKGTAPSWTFRGKVLVASPTGIVPSTIEITAEAPSNRVTGMPAMAGFSAAAVSVGGGSPGSDAGIVWKRSATNVFALYAEIKGKNADGSIAVVWKPLRPAMPTEAELRTYLADPRRS
jgi:hypothetical protein